MKTIREALSRCGLIFLVLLAISLIFSRHGRAEEPEVTQDVPVYRMFTSSYYYEDIEDVDVGYALLCFGFRNDVKLTCLTRRPDVEGIPVYKMEKANVVYIPEA